jgi:uncharacterized protein (TIGR02996 family)
METDGNPFLAEVLNHPEDDGPRLIYADWLEELGDPRGEFIRVQCELANTSPFEPQYYDLTERSQALLDEHREKWAGEIKQDIRRAEFHRGFVDTVTVRARAFAKEADALFRATPVHWLRFNYIKGAGSSLAALPALRKIRSLNLSDLKIPEEDLVAILSSPHLAELQELDLSYQSVPLSVQVGRALRNSPSCDTLRSLELIGECNRRFLNALLGGAGFPKLTHFGVGAEYSEGQFADLGMLNGPALNSLKVRGRLSVDDAQSVSQLPLEQLIRLDAQGTGIPARGISLFAEKGAFDQVEQLRLGSCELRISAVRSLLKDRQLSRCRSLDLSVTRNLADSGKMPEFIRLLSQHAPLSTLRELHLTHLAGSELEILASSDHLQELQQLELEHIQLSTRAAEAIAQSNWPRSLRQLSLKSATITTRAMGEFCSAQFANVLSLDMHGAWDFNASIEEEAMLLLVQSEAFPNLRTLTLDYTHLTARTLEAIARHGNFPELRTLLFDGNRADEESVRAVLTSERLPKLRRLSVNNTTGVRKRRKLQEEFGARIKT